MGPRAGLDGGKSRPTGIRSPDRPARSQSLYLLSYPTHINFFHCYIYPLIESVTNLLNHSGKFHHYLKLLATDYKRQREREKERETETPSWW